MDGTNTENSRQKADVWNDAFSALADEPRRRVVVSLLRTAPSDSVPLPEGATARGAAVDPARLRAELYHRHLPHLAERGYVEWETDPLTAFRGPRFGEVATVAEALSAYEGDLPPGLALDSGWFERDLGDPSAGAAATEE